jgi:hypothetical protein
MDAMEESISDTSNIPFISYKSVIRILGLGGIYHF